MIKPSVIEKLGSLIDIEADLRLMLPERSHHTPALVVAYAKGLRAALSIIVGELRSRGLVEPDEVDDLPISQGIYTPPPP